VSLLIGERRNVRGKQGRDLTRIAGDLYEKEENVDGCLRVSRLLDS
jgi:hypothetical protein